MGKEKLRARAKEPVDSGCTEIVTARVTPEEKAAYQKAAAQDERKLSQWIRVRLRAAVAAGKEASCSS